MSVLMHMTRSGLFGFWVALWLYVPCAQALNQEKERALIPAGEFSMGTEAGGKAELPIHKVWVDAFWIDRQEVSNHSYEIFLLGHQPSALSRCPTCPVTLVTWLQAEVYCKNHRGRLPTEAEWEKAARGPEGFAYSYATAPDAHKGRFGFPLQAGPVAVETFTANGFGLRHMSGNVWEWVEDWFAPYSGKPGKNPKGPIKGRQKVVRGGSWHNPSYYTHVGMRFKLAPESKLNSLGFRCAYDVEKKTG